MAIDCSVPNWLKAMRSITGLTEEPGSEDNPKIMGMRDWIACQYTDMKDYCEGYTGDDVAWCGLCAAWCVTVAGIRPPFGATDTDKFLWALAWADDTGFYHLDEPVRGCIVVMTRSGGGHITFYEETVDGMYRCRGGNQSDAVNVQSYDPSTVVALLWPKDAAAPRPPNTGNGNGDGDDEQRTLEEGDTGDDVAEVQISLGLPDDGEFGPVTEAGVIAFQGACGLDKDGVVGPATWDALDDLDEKMEDGDNGIDIDLDAQIEELVRNSPLNAYQWEDRGKAPPGYYAGMAKTFALAVIRYGAQDKAVTIMAKADTGDDNDALTWYRSEFEEKGMDNNRDGIDTLRHLFVMMFGLGMRESSGNHWEGRDMSAENVESDTCEAGLFQTSWNINSCSDSISEMFDEYWKDPNGFRETFTRGLEPTANNLGCYGSGDKGTQYQWLAKYSPAFAVLVTGVGLRLRGGEDGHWGPIRRHEVEIVDEVDNLLLAVERVMNA
jgi:uncharacterized protein (TIGR02594 family)